jgi:hypothetical protein
VQARANERPDSRLVYESDGRTWTVERIADDPTLGEPQNFVLRKVLFFRDVPPPEENVCRTLRDTRGPEQGS